MNVVICGSREFDDYELLKKELIKFFDNDFSDITIISGTAKGADSLGERFASEYNLPVQKFKPDWDKHGKSAGFKRNDEMVKIADVVVAFWNCKSKGTKHTINQANTKGIVVKIIKYEV